MERRVISMDRDPRREQFQLFSGYTFPYAGVTVQMDVTALELRLRVEHKPVFLTMLYVIHRAVNRVPELRRRIEDGQVVEYDECPVSFTELKPDGSYAYCRMETARIPYEDYIAMGRPAAGGGPAGRHHRNGPAGRKPLHLCLVPAVAELYGSDPPGLHSGRTATSGSAGGSCSCAVA